MRSFDYRAPRFPVNLPVRLTLQGSSWIGRCREISIEGLLLETHAPHSVDAKGVIHIVYCDAVLEVPVRVAHCRANSEGLQFQCESTRQREEVERFVDRLRNAASNAEPDELP